MRLSSWHKVQSALKKLLIFPAILGPTIALWVVVKRYDAIEMEIKKNGGYKKELKTKFELRIYLKEYMVNRISEMSLIGNWLRKKYKCCLFVRNAKAYPVEVQSCFNKTTKNIYQISTMLMALHINCLYTIVECDSL